MSLRILYVAYPLLPVTDASCGGAEQVLLTLEREMAARGHATVVAAAAGSRVAGELYRTGLPASGPDQFAQRDAEHNRRVLQLLTADDGFDLVHDMSGSFWKCAAAVELPVLATLHLPPQLYAAEMFEAIAPNVFFQCVSESQARLYAHRPPQLGVIHNGIDLHRFSEVSTETRGHGGKDENRGFSGGGDYLLWIGRVCQEKGPHIALEVAERSRRSLVLAGSVYPFSYHQQYFAGEIAPRLERQSRVRFVESPSFPEKLALMQNARALLITSLIDETSSLVAMEAMACGTPVIAFRRGALPGIVTHGYTGFLVDSIEEMVAARERVVDIDPRACREHVERRFSSARMAADYERLYQHVLEASARAQRRAGAFCGSTNLEKPTLRAA
jgi:glycosyltransferase involved in cell wall biosynthesis